MSVAAEKMHRVSVSQRKFEDSGGDGADLPTYLTDTGDTPWGHNAATVSSTHELYPRVPASPRSAVLPMLPTPSVASR